MRHLRAAMERAEELNEALGRSITPQQWRRVAATMGKHRQVLDEAQSELSGAAARSKHGLIPPAVHFLLAAAATVGAAELSDVTREYEDWLAELNDSSAPDAAAFRGVFALTRPDLHDRLQLNSHSAGAALEAHHRIDDERQKLALARG